MKHVIHVNHLGIRKNEDRHRSDPQDPVISVHDNRARGVLRQIWCNEVVIKDKRGRVVARVRYEPTKPLRTGATVWIEADNVEVVG